MAINNGQVVTIDQRGQSVYGDQYNAADDITVHHHGPQPANPLQRPPRAQHFTDRKAELAQLLEALQPGQVAILS